MQARISDIAEQLLFFISQLPLDDKHLSCHLKAESEISLAKLVQVLIKHKSLDMPANAATLDGFKLFLAARWQWIKNTDAVYMHSLTSSINMVCIELAKILSTNLQRSIYEFLMPSVKVPPNLKLCEFVLSNEEIPVEILSCLDDFRKTNLMQLAMADQEDAAVRLSAEEKDLIIHHSKEAHEYYKAMMLDVDEASIDLARKNLISAMETGTCKVTASYGKEGDQRLTKCICAGITKSSELISTIIKYVLPFKWQEFIKDIDNAELFRIILDVKLLGSQLPDRSNIQKSLGLKFDHLKTKLQESKITLFEKERRVRVWLLCVIEVYKRLRENGESYHSNYGYYFSFFPSVSGVYSEKEKIDAADALIKFVMSDISLTSLQSLKLIGSLKHHAGALSAGTLGWLCVEIEKLGEIFVKEQKELEFSTDKKM